jgi:parvulin-like peptidyl-prolyl isomerase
LQGGLLGKVKRGTLYPQLDDALFSMAEGAISPIVNTELGFHVLMCSRIEKEQKLKLSEVSEKIREKLQERNNSNFIRQWIKRQSAHGQVKQAIV